MRLNSEAPSSSPALTAGWICSSLYTDPPPTLPSGKIGKLMRGGRVRGGGGGVWGGGGGVCTQARFVLDSPACK